MPTPIVGCPHMLHGGLFTHEKNEDLNHFIKARTTQSWYPQAAFFPEPRLAASACNIWLSSSASLYILSSGTTFRASSSSPGFSHFCGMLDRVLSMARNRSDRASFGGEGINGMLRSEE